MIPVSIGEGSCPTDTGSFQRTGEKAVIMIVKPRITKSHTSYRSARLGNDFGDSWLGSPNKEARGFEVRTLIGLITAGFAVRTRLYRSMHAYLFRQFRMV